MASNNIIITIAKMAARNVFIWVCCCTDWVSNSLCWWSDWISNSLCWLSDCVSNSLWSLTDWVNSSLCWIVDSRCWASISTRIWISCFSSVEDAVAGLVTMVGLSDSGPLVVLVLVGVRVAVPSVLGLVGLIVGMDECPQSHFGCCVHFPDTWQIVNDGPVIWHPPMHS